MVDYYKINLENTINSGQVFLWEKKIETWYGVNGQDVLKIDCLGKIRSYSKNKIDFFRESDDLKEILKTISKDRVTNQAVKKILWFKVDKTRSVSMSYFFYCIFKF